MNKPTPIQASRLESFYRLGMPGMTLLKKPDVKPLLKRCSVGCGRVVSQTRSRCMACQQGFLVDVASQIADQDLFDAVLARCAPEDRQEFYDGIKPYLSFTPAPFASA